jgi:hypothetical protein
MLSPAIHRHLPAAHGSAQLRPVLSAHTTTPAVRAFGNVAITPMTTLETLRADFEQRTNRAMSAPIAGAYVWSVVAALGLVLPQRTAVIALMLASGVIFPLATVIARLRHEQLLDNQNPLAKLMGACVLMVNLLWALHVVLFIKAPALVPLSVGIALGLHWVVYSWIIGHPLGYVHALLRTSGLAVAWLLFPSNSVTACAAVVVVAYCVSLYQMAVRPIPAIARRHAEQLAGVSH